MERAELDWLRTRTSWTNVYGLARSVLAVGTFSTLAFNPAELFEPRGGLIEVPVASWSLFRVLDSAGLEPARWLALVILTLVITGWRPRWTGMAHWWVTWSVSVSCIVPDGGDQVAASLTALMIPVTLTDARRWHWQPELAVARTFDGALAASSLLVIRIQMAVIYFHAAVAKLNVTEWMNGTALYYWLTHPSFGMPRSLEPMIVAGMAHAAILVPLTWGVILLEVLLFAGLFMDRRWWPGLLLAGLAFHSAIWIVHGLGSFFFAMAGGLVLYLRPIDEPYRMGKLRSLTWRPYHRAGAGCTLEAKT